MSTEWRADMRVIHAQQMVNCVADEDRLCAVAFELEHDMAGGSGLTLDNQSSESRARIELRGQRRSRDK